MDDLLVVRRLHPFEDAPEQPQLVFEVELGGLFDDLGQGAAVDQLHGDEFELAPAAEVVDPADVGVHDLAGELDFLLEAGEPVLAVAVVVDQQHLDRHRFFELEVAGTVDRSHTA